jgi:hypothetical protein
MAAIGGAVVAARRITTDTCCLRVPGRTCCIQGLQPLVEGSQQLWIDLWLLCLPANGPSGSCLALLGGHDVVLLPCCVLLLLPFAVCLIAVVSTVVCSPPKMAPVVH